MHIGIGIESSSNLCIVSGYTRDNSNWVELGAMTDRTKLFYARKWDYGFRSYWEGFDKTRPASWSKLLFIKDALETYEWVFWTDADAGITNYELDIKKHCKEDKDFIIEQDGNGINCGAFLLKQGKFADWLIDTVWKMEKHINHIWWEQAAIKELYDWGKLEGHIEVIKKSDSFLINTYRSNWKEGSFIIHLAGEGQGNGRGRIGLMTEFLKAAKNSGYIKEDF